MEIIILNISLLNHDFNSFPLYSDSILSFYLFMLSFKDNHIHICSITFIIEIIYLTIFNRKSFFVAVL